LEDEEEEDTTDDVDTPIGEKGSIDAAAIDEERLVW